MFLSRSNANASEALHLSVFRRLISLSLSVIEVIDDGQHYKLMLIGVLIKAYAADQFITLPLF